jgi:galactonate dehydratase
VKLSRRSLLKAALGMPAATWLLLYRAAAALPCRSGEGNEDLIRIETDAGIIGYGEAGLPSAAARARIEMMAPQLIGQDPLAIKRHFYMMAATQYSFMANIATVSGIDIALWDLAGKITGYPIYRLLGGPVRKNIPVYSHGGPAVMLDKAQCKAWGSGEIGP